jgi:hypothetical protein
MNLCSAGCVDRRAGKARHREIASRENRDWRPEDGMISGRSLALHPRRAQQAPPWAWLRARARHGSG